MNRELAKTVLSIFRTQDVDSLRRRFAAFEDRDWRRTTHWLHTSGMALYFLDRSTRLGIVDAMPPRLMGELSINLLENRARTADLFEDFARLNTAFQRAGISYVNIRGFSLAPAAFADPALSYQQGLDVIVARRDVARCAPVMDALGYRFRRIGEEGWEFYSGATVKTSTRDLYRVRPVRNVELHPVSPEEEALANHSGDRLSRMKLQVWNGFEFPALGDADQLLLQASHIFRHLQGEWTRTAWLLEYSNAADARKDDTGTWQDVASALEAAPQSRTGIAIATLVTEQAFGLVFPEKFRECTIGRLAPGLRLWVERYRDDLTLSPHPGSKLYLLLQELLENDCAQWRATRRKKLPLHSPYRAMPRDAVGLRMKWTAEVEQLRFAAKRFWFHVVKGLQYKLEAARWRRFMAGAGL